MIGFDIDKKYVFLAGKAPFALLARTVPNYSRSNGCGLSGNSASG
jgi:hypothetical protein